METQFLAQKEAVGVISIAFGLGYVLHSSQLAVTTSVFGFRQSIFKNPQRFSLFTLLVSLSLWSTFTFVSLLLHQGVACTANVVLSQLFSQSSHTAGDAFAAFTLRDGGWNPNVQTLFGLLMLGRIAIGIGVVATTSTGTGATTQTAVVPRCNLSSHVSSTGVTTGIIADSIDVVGLGIALLWAWMRWRRDAERGGSKSQGLWLVMAGLVGWAIADFPFSIGGTHSIFVRLIPTILTLAILLAFIRIFPIPAKSGNVFDDHTYPLQQVTSYASDLPRGVTDLEMTKPGLHIRSNANLAPDRGGSTGSELFRNILGRPIMDMNAAEAHPGSTMPWAEAPPKTQSVLLPDSPTAAVLQHRVPHGTLTMVSNPTRMNNGFGQLEVGSNIPARSNTLRTATPSERDRIDAEFEQEKQKFMESTRKYEEPMVSPVTIRSFAAIGGMGTVSAPSSVSEERPAIAKHSISAVKRRNVGEEGPSAPTHTVNTRNSSNRSAGPTAEDYHRYSGYTFSTSEGTGQYTSSYSAGTFPLGVPPIPAQPQRGSQDEDQRVLLLNEIVYDNPALVQSLTQSRSTSRYTRSAPGLTRRSPPGTGKPPLSPPREAEESTSQADGETTPVIERKRSIKRQSLRALFPARESRHLTKGVKRKNSKEKKKQVLGSPPPPPTQPLPAPPPVPKTPTKYTPKTSPVASLPHIPPPSRAPPLSASPNISPLPFTPPRAVSPLRVPDKSQFLNPVELQKHLSGISLQSSSTEIDDAYEIAKTWVASVSTVRPVGPVLVSIRRSRHGSVGNMEYKSNHQRDSSLDSGIGSDIGTLHRADSDVMRPTYTVPGDSIHTQESTVLMKPLTATLAVLTPAKEEDEAECDKVENGETRLESESESDVIESDSDRASGDTKDSNRHGSDTDSDIDPDIAIPIIPDFYDDGLDADDELFSDGGDSYFSEEIPPEELDHVMTATEKRLVNKIQELSDAIPPLVRLSSTAGRYFQLGDHIPKFHSSRGEQYGSKRKAPPPALADFLQYRRRIPPPSPPIAEEARDSSGIRARLSTVLNKPAPPPLEDLLRKLPMRPPEEHRDSVDFGNRTSVLARNSLLERLETEMGAQETAWRGMRTTLMQRASIASSGSLESNEIRSRRGSQRRSLLERLQSGTARRLSMSTTTEQMTATTSTGATSAAASAGAWQQQIADAQLEYARRAPELEEKLREWMWPGSTLAMDAFVAPTRPQSKEVEECDTTLVEDDITPLPSTVYHGEDDIVPSPEEISQREILEEVRYLPNDFGYMGHFYTSSPTSSKSDTPTGILQSDIPSPPAPPAPPAQVYFLWQPFFDPPEVFCDQHLWSGKPLHSVALAAAIETRPKRRYDNVKIILASKNLWTRHRAPESAIERGLWRNPRDFRPKSIMQRRRAPSVKRVTFVEDVVTVEPTGIFGRLKKLWGRGPKPVETRIVPIDAPPVPMKFEAERLAGVSNVLHGIAQIYQHKELPQVPADTPSVAPSVNHVKTPELPKPAFAGKLWIALPPRTSEADDSPLWPAAAPLPSKLGYASARTISRPRALPVLRVSSNALWRSSVPRAPSPSLGSVPSPKPEKLWTARLQQTNTASTSLWPAAPALPLNPRDHSVCRKHRSQAVKALRISSCTLWTPLPAPRSHSSRSGGLWFSSSSSWKSEYVFAEKLWNAREQQASTSESSFLWPAAPALPLQQSHRSARSVFRPQAITVVHISSNVLWTPPPPAPCHRRRQNQKLWSSPASTFEPTIAEKLWIARPQRTSTSHISFLWPTAPTLSSQNYHRSVYPRSRSRDTILPRISSNALWTSYALRTPSPPSGGLWSAPSPEPECELVGKLWTADVETCTAETTLLWPAAQSLPLNPCHRSAHLRARPQAVPVTGISSTALWAPSVSCSQGHELSSAPPSTPEDITAGLWPFDPDSTVRPALEAWWRVSSSRVHPQPPRTNVMLRQASAQHIAPARVSEPSIDIEHSLTADATSKAVWDLSRSSVALDNTYAAIMGLAAVTVRSRSSRVYPQPQTVTLRKASAQRIAPVRVSEPRVTVEDIPTVKTTSKTSKAVWDLSCSSVALSNIYAVITSSRVLLSRPAGMLVGETSPNDATGRPCRIPSPAAADAVSAALLDDGVNTPGAHINNFLWAPACPPNTHTPTGLESAAPALWSDKAGPSCRALLRQPTGRNRQSPFDLSNAHEITENCETQPPTKRRRRALPPPELVLVRVEPDNMDGLWQPAPPPAAQRVLSPPLQLWGRRSTGLGIRSADRAVRPLRDVLSFSAVGNERIASPGLLWSRSKKDAEPVFAGLSQESFRSKRDHSTKALAVVEEGLWVTHEEKRKRAPKPRENKEQKVQLWTPPKEPAREPVMWSKDNKAAADVFAHLPTNDTLRSKKDLSLDSLPIFSEDLWKKRVHLPARPQLWVSVSRPTGMWEVHGRTANLDSMRPAKRQKALWNEKTASRTTEKLPEQRTRCAFVPSNAPLPVVGGSLWKKPTKKAPKGLWTTPVRRTRSSTTTVPASPLWNKETASRTTVAIPGKSAPKKPLPNANPRPVTGPLWTPAVATKAKQPLTLWKRTVTHYTAAPASVTISGIKSPLWSASRRTTRTTTATPVRTTVKIRPSSAPLTTVSGLLWTPPAPAKTNSLWQRAPGVPKTRPRRASTLWAHDTASRTTTARPVRPNIAPRKPDSAPLRSATGAMWSAPATPAAAAIRSADRLWGSPATPALSRASTISDGAQDPPSPPDVGEVVRPGMWEPAREAEAKTEVVTPLWPSAQPAVTSLPPAGRRSSKEGREKEAIEDKRKPLPRFERDTHAMWAPKGGEKIEV